VARQQATGALQAHAYDQPEVWPAGTLALEIEEQAAAARQPARQRGRRRPDRRRGRLGGQPSPCGGAGAERAPTLHAARAAGMPVDVEVGGLAADSLGARIGAIAWEVSQRHVHDALLLPDDAIVPPTVAVAELKLAVEPAAALGWRPCRPAPTAPSHVKPWR
jgi:threonine dehydratase